MDIDKLKALALAYVYENGGHWYSEHQVSDGISYEPASDFIVGCSPATVLELIAEVEKLRTQLVERVSALRAEPASQHDACTCAYATSANTESVRKGYEMGGYIKQECDACKNAATRCRAEGGNTNGKDTA